MSTRATYEICGTPFYCHWDGYPTGAAQRFAAMVKALTVYSSEEIGTIEGRRGGFAFAFIRGVMDAEPTEGHEAHGDTEYRYTLKAKELGAATITVHERVGTWEFDKPSKWRVQFEGDLADWLNQMRGKLEAVIRDAQARYPKMYSGDPVAEALESIPVIVRVEEIRDYCTVPSITYATLENAKKIKEALWAKSNAFQADNPNKKGYARTDSAWSAAIVEASCSDKKDVAIAAE